MKTPITLYIRFRNPVVSSQFIVIRRVLQNCFWVESQSETVRLTGNIPTSTIQCQVFDDGITYYIEPHEFNKYNIFNLPNNIWTVDNLDLPIIVKGIVTHEFSQNWGSSTTPETQFLNITPNSARVERADDNRRGTPQSRFILLRA